MSQTDRKLVEASPPAQCFLRSTTAVSLNERFSQVLVDQLTRCRKVTLSRPLLQQRMVSCPPPVVLVLKRETSPLLNLQTRDSSVRLKQRLRRRSVWTRLGWQHVTRRLSASRLRGFWSFRNKYRWRAGFSSTYRIGPQLSVTGNLGCGLCQRRLLMRRNLQKLTAGQTQPSLHLQGGGATASRGCDLSKDGVPTKRQLDAQLDEYMSRSKSRLDQQLDEYMSRSKRRLDAELDEYMAMAGQTHLHWD